MAVHRASGSTKFATVLTTLLLILTCTFGVYLVGNAVFGAVDGGGKCRPTRTFLWRIWTRCLPRSSTQSRFGSPWIRNAEPYQLLLATLRDLMVVALAVAFLWLVRRLLISVREGDPFTAANVRRLRAIGFVLIIGFPLSTYIGEQLEMWLARSSTVGEIGHFTVTSNIEGVLVIGLLVFVLAEVFAHGVRLREDVEGTV